MGGGIVFTSGLLEGFVLEAMDGMAATEDTLFFGRGVEMLN
jgi:hypothetical protein